MFLLDLDGLSAVTTSKSMLRSLVCVRIVGCSRHSLVWDGVTTVNCGISRSASQAIVAL